MPAGLLPLAIAGLAAALVPLTLTVPPLVVAGLPLLAASTIGGTAPLRVPG